MIDMNAKKEIQKWLEQHRRIDAEEAREQFFQNLRETLGNKDSDNLHQVLSALRESVRTTRRRVEKSVKTKPVGYLQVFPKNPEEQELLQQLLERMSIPFKLTT